MAYSEDFVVNNHGKDRVVKCASCGDWVKKSILPHLKKEHPKIWNSWQNEFVRLWNKGLTSKEIMKEFNTLFTWSVIEKEIQKFGEANPHLLEAHKKAEISEWKPKGFQLERSTVWSFKKRGDWAVHSPEYRGNWAPQVPRNLVLLFSRPGQTVLDPFVGGGTTLIECHLEGINTIGVDISPWAVKTSRSKIKELQDVAEANPEYNLPDIDLRIEKGDARCLYFIDDKSIDLICAHPPYSNALQYTSYEEDDLSRISDIDDFIREMGNVAVELKRVLSAAGKCAVLIGDIWQKGRFIPLEYHVTKIFRKAGFKLWERIIKLQYSDKSTSFYLNLIQKKRHWIAHEYLLLFSK